MAKPYPPAGARGVLYLIHLERPLPHHVARGAKQHYLGWTMDLRKRMWGHTRHPERTLVLREAARHGIRWSVVKTWPDQTRTDERRRKNGAHLKRDCPECRTTAHMDRVLGPESDWRTYLSPSSHA